MTAGIVLISVIGIAAFFLISLQQNWGKVNTVVIRNESGRTLTDVTVWTASDRHALDPIPPGTMGLLEVPAGPEGAVRVAFTLDGRRVACEGSYITHGINSYSEVRVNAELALSRRLNAPQTGETSPYHPCPETAPAS
jgi:hypothetical protein